MKNDLVYTHYFGAANILTVAMDGENGFKSSTNNIFDTFRKDLAKVINDEVEEKVNSSYFYDIYSEIESLPCKINSIATIAIAKAGGFNAFDLLDYDKAIVLIEKAIKSKLGNEVYTYVSNSQVLSDCLASLVNRVYHVIFEFSISIHNGQHIKRSAKRQIEQQVQMQKRQARSIQAA